MCIVTYVASGSQLILTSNRDETLARPAAVPPDTYHLGDKQVLYPRDPVAGGSWFTIDEFGNGAVLLNGAGEKHVSAGSYRRSRGLVLMDIIGAFSPGLKWKTIDLEEIEPFTIILLENRQLFHLSWNGGKKTRTKLPATGNYLWSSATLYPREVRVLKEAWFREYLSGKGRVTPDEMMSFHRSARIDERDSMLQTISITQATIAAYKVEMRYLQFHPTGESIKMMPLCM